LLNAGIKKELTKKYGLSYDFSSINSQGIDDVKLIIKNKIPGIDNVQIDALVKDGIGLGNEEFWAIYNQPFLQAAFARGDDIRLVSDPKVFGVGAGFYAREINEIEKIGGLKTKYGYIFVSPTSTYVKP
jgi:hypothetical protein